MDSQPVGRHAESPALPAPPGMEQKLRNAADQIEAQFLTEMLKASESSQSKTFGGDVGEEQFTSFLLREQAHSIVKAGGVGLAEAIFNSLRKEVSDG